MQLTKLATCIALSPLFLSSLALPTVGGSLGARQDTSDAFPPDAGPAADAVLNQFLAAPKRRSVEAEAVSGALSKRDWADSQIIAGTRTTTYFKYQGIAIASGNLAQLLSNAIHQAIANSAHDGPIPGNTWSVRNGREVITFTNAPGQHFTWGIAATALAEIINGLLGGHRFFEGSMDVVDLPWGLIGYVDISSGP